MLVFRYFVNRFLILVLYFFQKPFISLEEENIQNSYTIITSTLCILKIQPELDGVVPNKVNRNVVLQFTHLVVELS